jgi:hypothetical protein
MSGTRLTRRKREYFNTDIYHRFRGIGRDGFLLTQGEGNGQIGKVRVDDVVDIKDCYIANFAGEPQLRIGRTETISAVV